MVEGSLVSNDNGSPISSITGKDGVVFDDGNLDAPDNVIPSSHAARTVYSRLREHHIKRCWGYERIQGMLDGNPPYNPKELRRAGLSDMTNVNWKDGDAIFKSVALSYWSLFNEVENIVEFKVNLAPDDGVNALWGRILSEEWDRVIRSWPNFSKHMNFHQSELLKFGLNAIIWPDEKDWRFKPVNIKSFLLPDQTSNDIDEVTTVAIEHTFTAQFLWEIFRRFDGKDGKEWDAEALGEILWRLSNVSDEQSDYNVSHCHEMQKRIRNGDTYFDALYNDEITLVSIFQEEFDGKVSHYMIHPRIETEEFPFFVDRQYDDMREAFMYFCFAPGEETIHGNKGVGHSIFAPVEAITQLDCSVLDQSRRASSLIIKSGPTRGRDDRQVRFVHGGVIDVGEADIQQNSMGNNVGQTVEASRYFKQKIFANNNIAGVDPAFADRNAQSAKAAQLQATREARIQKNQISHYYEQLDHFFREVIRKMLNAKPSYPGYEYVKTWKDRALERGVPEELFKVDPKQLAPDGLPMHIEVFTTRSSGSGSQFADQIEMQQMMQVLPTLGERGRISVLQDFIAAFRGFRYVQRYFPPEDRDQQPTGDDTIASIENNQLKEGDQIVVSPDNNHAVHATNHVRMLSELMKAYQENPEAVLEENGETLTILQKTDRVFAVGGPHFVKHLFFLGQDPTRRALVEQLNAQWGILANFGDFIANNASKQREADLRKVQEKQRALAQAQDQNTPEMIKARADVQLKQQKLEAQIERDKFRDQNRFLLRKEEIENNSKLKELETVNKLAIDAAKALKDEGNAE